jgi:hypothetical protein
MAKKYIPKKIKQLVWNKYIGEIHGIGPCHCCKITEISQMNFHCGHIISEFDGGATILDNLAPVCALCNLSMGKTNMNVFMKTYGLDNKNKINKINNKQIKIKPIINSIIEPTKIKSINKQINDNFLNKFSETKLKLICIFLEKSYNKKINIDNIKNEYTIDDINKIINFYKSDLTIVSYNNEIFYNEFYDI